ncbi:MAG: PLP-dependent aminotransferase family protein [Caulobacteraceae bacterium]|nr:PLP-dependent aminotransferase family protein [Caulobacteraceae bacterium]
MLRPWPLTIVLDRRSDTPIGLQIVHSIIEEVRRGRLKPGTPLPGTRELADSLGVNRKTVIIAFAELQAQGWLSSETRRGTFVAENLPLLDAGSPDSPPIPDRPLFRPSRAISNLVADVPPRDMLAFDDGAPDIRHVPVDILARAYRDGLRGTLQRRRLGYGDPRGSEPLRASIAAMLSAERGLAVTADNLCLTRGSQMAIFVAAQTLVSAGDTVVVEELSYPPAREAFRRAGAEIASVGVDAQGLLPDDLERVCRRKRVRAVYVTPHHHFPTTVLMTPERRMRLMLLASQFGFAVVEDDYDHDFHFTHQPMLPLAAFDGEGRVVYIGSLSKVLSPSLRMGYVSAPKALTDRIAAEVMMVDRQGDPAMEAAIAEFIEAGELHRHTRKMMRLYAERRERFAELLPATFGEAIALSVPDGGLAFWVRFQGVDLEQLLERAHARRVHFQSPRPFASNGVAVDALRLGFAGLDLGELEAATERLGAAHRDVVG